VNKLFFEIYSALEQLNNFIFSQNSIGRSYFFFYWTINQLFNQQIGINFFNFKDVDGVLS
jgi:hypothetical protein